MRYFIISQNLVKSDLKLPMHAILRVNLAWHKDLDSVKTMLDKYRGNDVFLDIPIGRKKPPNHNHDVDDIANTANEFANVRYVGISNVENIKDVHYYCKKFRCRVVPKIETYKGAMRSSGIIDALNYKPQIVMLDHEDLFSDLVRLKKEKHYLKIINALIATCRKKNTHLLRVKGIIFAND